MTLRACSVPDCGALTDHGKCRRCRAIDRRQRTARDPSLAVYSSTDWRRTRARQLALHPLCPCGQPATVADHRVPRKQLIERGVTNPDDPRWLQSLCAPCHGRKTATFDGGLGRPAADR